ncbi:MAG: hypothetical protein HKN87_18690 [Saprospiraceae bacterium]|nr:hypothetical protein [Saprospiraceae bacterium]
MDFNHLLSQHLNRSDMLGIVNYIGNDQHRFDVLFELFCYGPPRIAQRASWLVSNCVERHPLLIANQYDGLLDMLENPTHAAIKRNAVRLLTFIEIPTRWQGPIYEKCFQLAHSPEEAIALRSFSLKVLFNIAKDHPDLLVELDELLHDCAQSDSPGILSRIRNLRKAIEKIRGD